MKKVYIVANEQQEREVLEKLEREGLVWIGAGEKPTEWKPVKEGALCSLPYALVVSSYVAWLSLSQLEDEEIVYDGRTELEPIKVSKETMEDIKQFVGHHKNEFQFLYDFTFYPVTVTKWLKEKPAERVKLLVDYIEGNITLTTTEQYVLRSIDPDENGDYSYLRLGPQSTSVPDIEVAQIKLEEATHFETREEATEFLIAGMEIAEVKQ